MYRVAFENKTIIDDPSAMPFHEMTVSHQFQCLAGHLTDAGNEACSVVEIKEIPQGKTSKFHCRFFVGRPATYRTKPIKPNEFATVIYAHQPPCTFLCQDLGPGIQSGVHRISVAGTSDTYNANVFCDMADVDGWTTIQRRVDGSENFYRAWSDYKTGFGDPRRNNGGGEYWLGLDIIHLITKSFKNVLIRIKATAVDGDEMTMIFEGFSIKDEAQGYKLVCGKFLEGDAAFKSDWTHANGAKFSTLGVDNDSRNGICGELSKGGWWYTACAFMNPNGLYSSSGNNGNRGIFLRRGGSKGVPRGSWNPLRF